MILTIQPLVEEACKKDTNYFGYTIWSHHIVPVFKCTQILAQKLDADEEIVGLAALLHDYASIKKEKWIPEHHIHGARLAEKVLKKFNYPEDKIQEVTHCILTHRGSKSIPRETLEAHIVASADAMAHFDHVESLFYIAFVKKGMNQDEAISWVVNKLENDWKKLMPEAKEIIHQKYEAVKVLFSDTF
ncbi:MAG: HD domain-containing protein [Candidatus Methanofastidiosia archaeon]|jgi:uncharacterized protein